MEDKFKGDKTDGLATQGVSFVYAQCKALAGHVQSPGTNTTPNSPCPESVLMGYFPSQSFKVVVCSEYIFLLRNGII